MSVFFEGLGRLELFFVVCALIGGGMLLLRLLLLLVGFGDHGEGADVHPDSDTGFQLLSIQGITAFFMMFGLVGYALLRTTTWSAAFASVGAVVAGIGSMFLIQRIFLSMGRLQSSGTLPTDRAVGGDGSVYLTIPARGTGRVQVAIAGRLREFEATSADGGALATGELVRVTGVSGDVLVVERKVN